MKSLFAWFITLLVFPAAMHAGILYDVSLDTAPLIGLPAGPFSLAFQLADGSGTGDGNNAAVLTNFQFGGGGVPFGAPITLGSAFGDLSSAVVLTDSSFANFFAQSFTPGDTVSFLLDLTTNVDAGPVPDEFTFSILDNTLNPIPTTAGMFFDVFVQIDIDSSNPTVTIYASDTSRVPVAGGGPIDLGLPTVQTVPEPNTMALVGVVASLLFLRRKHS